MSELMKDDDLKAFGVEIIHHMPDDGSGVYIKETRIPSGVKLGMHTHTFTHKSVLVSGRSNVSTNGDASAIEAPFVLTIKEGDAHEVSAICDCVWLCIHATKECDPEKIDHTLVAHA